MPSSYGEYKHNILALVGKANKANPRFPSLIAATSECFSFVLFRVSSTTLVLGQYILSARRSDPTKATTSLAVVTCSLTPQSVPCCLAPCRRKSVRGKRCLPHLVTQQWRGDQNRHSRLRYCSFFRIPLSLSTWLSMVGPSGFVCIEQKCHALPRRRGNSICIGPSPPHVLSKNFGFRLSSEKATRVRHMRRQ